MRAQRCGFFGNRAKRARKFFAEDGGLVRFKLVEAGCPALIGLKAVGAMPATTFAAVAPAVVVQGREHHPTVVVEVVLVGGQARDPFFG
jgi:hypothetical protein